MTAGSLDGLGPFVIELVAQVDDEQRRGYVGGDAFVPLPSARAPPCVASPAFKPGHERVQAGAARA